MRNAEFQIKLRIRSNLDDDEDPGWAIGPTFFTPLAANGVLSFSAIKTDYFVTLKQIKDI